jgi:hypothetical protein
MNVEIGTEAAQFPEKEYINGIIVAELVNCVRVRVELVCSVKTTVLTVYINQPPRSTNATSPVPLSILYVL